MAQGHTASYIGAFAAVMLVLHDLIQMSVFTSVSALLHCEGSLYRS
jgi:hypothetical protein